MFIIWSVWWYMKTVYACMLAMMLRCVICISKRGREYSVNFVRHWERKQIIVLKIIYFFPLWIFFSEWKRRKCRMEHTQRERERMGKNNEILIQKYSLIWKCGSNIKKHISYKRKWIKMMKLHVRIKVSAINLNEYQLAKLHLE